MSCKTIDYFSKFGEKSHALSRELRFTSPLLLGFQKLFCLIGKAWVALRREKETFSTSLGRDTQPHWLSGIYCMKKGGIIRAVLHQFGISGEGDNIIRLC